LDRGAAGGGGAVGSYLAVCHPAKDVQVEGAAEAAERLGRLQVGGLTLRTYAEVARFFEGLAWPGRNGGRPDRPTMMPLLGCDALLVGR